MSDALAPHTAETLLDYQSPHGPRVTHVRGLVMIDALDNLKQWGVYEQYLAQLSDEQREWLASTLATSWIPVERVELHYELVGRLGVEDRNMEESAKRLATRVGEMYLSAALRASLDRDTGIAEYARALSKNDKMWGRFYQGGGSLVLRLSPRQFVVENYGNPLFRHHPFRHAYIAYLKANANLFCPGVRVRTVPAARQGEDRLPVEISW